jgi:hypothetical protein
MLYSYYNSNYQFIAFLSSVVRDVLSICIYFSESSEDESSFVDSELPRKRLRSAFTVDGTGIKYSK